MDHQDWKPITLNKPKKHIVEKTKVVKKNLNSNSFININAKKIEEEDVKIEYVPKSIGIEIQKARSLLKLSQQDLANKLCVKKNIINDLESGKILKSNNVIRKALNILKIK